MHCEQEDEDENVEDNDEFQEGKLRFAGGRGEKATYDAGDDEDREIEAAARKEAATKEGDLEQVPPSLHPLLRIQS